MKRNRQPAFRDLAARDRAWGKHYRKLMTVSPLASLRPLPPAARLAIYTRRKLLGTAPLRM